MVLFPPIVTICHLGFWPIAMATGAEKDSGGQIYVMELLIIPRQKQEILAWYFSYYSLSLAASDLRRC